MKHRCKRHNVSYGALEQCPQCTAGDPATPPLEDVAPLPVAPDGCLSSIGREAWYTALANAAIADADRLAAAGDDPESGWHADVAIKGHRDTAIKAMRAAGELGTARETDALVERRKREQ